MSQQPLAIYNPLTNQVQTWIRPDHGGYRPPDGWELRTKAELPAGWTLYDPRDLDAERAVKIEAIDARSAALLLAGFPLPDGRRISTSLAAQQNLQDLMIAIHSAVPNVLPQGISTTDGGEYLIRDTKQLTALVGQYRAWKLQILDCGRKLRAEVLAAKSLTALDAVADSRTVITADEIEPY